MTNTQLLREKMEQSGYKLRFIAAKLGITYQGFLNKVENKTEFTASEIHILFDLLNMSEAERNSIFFAVNVE
ncbi:helix-turn-helix transcriptional regulator [Oscillospiraceae bacterium 50-58]